MSKKEKHVGFKELARRRSVSELITAKVRADLEVEFREMLHLAGIATKKVRLLAIENPDVNFTLAGVGKPHEDGSVSIVLTTSTLNLLNRDEVIAILAHEIAHIHFNDPNSGASRTKSEYRADRYGAEISGRPKALISALIKMDRYLSIQERSYLDEVLPRAVSKRGSLRRAFTERALEAIARASRWMNQDAHPDMNDRIKRLHKLPDQQITNINDVPYLTYLSLNIQQLSDSSPGTQNKSSLKCGDRSDSHLDLSENSWVQSSQRDLSKSPTR